MWGATTAIASTISQLDLAYPNSLPDLRSGPSLLLASDYGGQHKSAPYEAFSFLIADLSYCGDWNQMRSRIRKEFLRDNRRMGYKGMNDRRKRSALLPFLRAADNIPGLVLTVLVDKRLQAELLFSGAERGSVPDLLQSWPVPVVKKFIWVIHVGSALVAGLSAKGQNLLWITDEDDIAANDSRIIEATPLVAGILSQYLPHDMAHLRFGTTKCDSGDLLLEDFAAIPDLAAGALVEIPKVDTVRLDSGVRTPLRGYVPWKALSILSWLGRGSGELRKISVVVDQGDSGAQVRARALDLHMTA